jgi:O-antigen/teichoic acid export membrane protein
MQDSNLDEKFKLDKTRNTTKGIAAGLLNRVITMLIPFVVRTLLIKMIGIEYAGLNSLFASILQVLNLAELGFSSAIVYSMYKPIAERDEDTVCVLLNFYRRIYLVVGIVILVAGLILLPFLPRLINGALPADINIYIVYLIFLANTGASYLLYGYKTSLLNAYQRVDVISNIGSVITLLLNLAQIAVLLIFANFYLYVLLIPLLTIVQNLATSHIVDKMFPQYRCNGKVSPELRHDIWKKVTGLMIQKICGASRNTFASIFISAFISLSVVGIYNNYYMVFAALTYTMGLIPAAMVSGIGNDVQTSSVEDNYNSLRKFNCMFMLISTIISVCMFSLYQPFMELWMGRGYMFGYSTVILLVVSFYLLRMGDIRSIWVDAVGLYWEIRWRAVLEAVLNIALNYIFIQIWGVNGLIAGTIISLFLVNFIYSSSITFKYYFGYKRLIPYYLIQMFHIAAMAVICSVCYYTFTAIEHILGISNLWIIFVERFLLSITFSIIGLFLAFHRTNDYKLAVSWIKLKVHGDCR